MSWFRRKKKEPVKKGTGKAHGAGEATWLWGDMLPPQEDLNYGDCEDAYDVPMVRGSIDMAAYAVCAEGLQFKDLSSPEQELEDDHPIYMWADEVNLEDHVFAATVGSLLYGDWYWERIDWNGMPAVKDVRPHLIKIKVDRKTGSVITGYTQKLFAAQKDAASWKPGEMIGFHWNPMKKAPGGTSIVRPIVLRILSYKLNMEAIQYNTFRQFAQPIIVVTPAEGMVLDETEAQSLADSIADQVREKKKIIVLPRGGVELRILGAERKMPDFSHYIDHIEGNVVSALFTPWIVLGKGETSTEATAKVQIGVYNYFIKKVQRFIADKVNTWLLQPHAELWGLTTPRLVFPEPVSPVFRAESFEAPEGEEEEPQEDKKAEPIKAKA